MRKVLSKSEIKEVKDQAKSVLGICRKTNEIIGTQIFYILGLYARIIYYPLGEKGPWGFTRIKGNNYHREGGKSFVTINTSVPLPCQVFAAAHELYHILYDKDPDMLPGNLLDEDGETECDIDEKKANRFAAEFLMDEMVLRQELDLYKIRQIGVKEVLKLAKIFTVPYKAMVKRLWEEEVISDDKKKNLLSESDESIERYRKLYAVGGGKGDNKIALDNLVELAVDAYGKKLVTFEKLEYLLRLCGLTPKELGINRANVASLPSEKEIEGIMEGEE